MDKVAQAIAQFRALEENFKVADIHEWHSAHVEVPIFAVCGYLVLVFWVPGVLEAWKIKLQLTSVMILWNVFLATFSIMGAFRMVPVLLEGLMSKGFEESVCANGDWFLNGKPGLWMALFIYSKFPELVDTVFLVFKRRPVILLHWFHHCTVLMYCWHAYLHLSGPGIWFCTMNYCVHAIMYSYYAAMAARLGKFLNVLAPLITSIQILQMVGGLIVTVTAGRRLMSGGTCAADPANLKLGFAMYLSYFVLFFMLFMAKYMTPKGKKGGSSSNPEDAKMVCGVDVRRTDTAGRFADHSNAEVKANGSKKHK